jgi:hypothetical protein
LAHPSDAPAPWAHISVEVYAWLAEHVQHGSGDGFKVSEMYVRSHQIKLHGSAAGDDLRDMRLLMDWFRRDAADGIDEARSVIPNWRALPVPDMLKLRQIKNRLGVFAQIKDHLNEDESREILPWLELRMHLP